MHFSLILLAVLLSSAISAQVAEERYLTIAPIAQKQPLAALILDGEGIYTHATYTTDLLGLSIRHSKTINARMRIGFMASVLIARPRTELHFSDSEAKVIERHVQPYHSKSFGLAPLMSHFALYWQQQLAGNERSSLWIGLNMGSVMQSGSMFGVGVRAELDDENSAFFRTRSRGGIFPSIGSNLTYEFLFTNAHLIQLSIENLVTFNHFHHDELKVRRNGVEFNAGSTSRLFTLGISVGYTFAWGAKRGSDRPDQDADR